MTNRAGISLNLEARCTAVDHKTITFYDYVLACPAAPLPRARRAWPPARTTAATGWRPPTGQERQRPQAEQATPQHQHSQAGATRPPIACAQGGTDYPPWGELGSPRAVIAPHITRPKNCSGRSTARTQVSADEEELSKGWKMTSKGRMRAAGDDEEAQRNAPLPGISFLRSTPLDAPSLQELSYLTKAMPSGGNRPRHAQKQPSMSRGEKRLR